MITCTKRVGNKGEILIPKNVREAIGIKPRQKVEIISSKNGLFIVPLVNDIKELRGLFGKEGIKNLNKVEDIMLEIMAGS